MSPASAGEVALPRPATQEARRRAGAHRDANQQVVRAHETNREPSDAVSPKVSGGASERSRWDHRKLLLRASVGDPFPAVSDNDEKAVGRFRPRSRNTQGERAVTE